MKGSAVFSVNSEVGRLREVIVHRPGVELTRLTPDNVDSLLFDDVMWVERARDEHDLFAKQLVDHGVTVHHFADLLAEALDADGAREFVASRLATHERFGLMLSGAIGELVRSYPAAQLADVLIGGLTKRDLGDSLDTPEPAAAQHRRRTTSSSPRCPTTCSSATTRPGSTARCR